MTYINFGTQFGFYYKSYYQASLWKQMITSVGGRSFKYRPGSLHLCSNGMSKNESNEYKLCARADVLLSIPFGNEFLIINYLPRISGIRKTSVY